VLTASLNKANTTATQTEENVLFPGGVFGGKAKKIQKKLTINVERNT
jgi:hypothetical protein